VGTCGDDPGRRADGGGDQRRHGDPRRVHRCRRLRRPGPPPNRQIRRATDARGGGSGGALALGEAKSCCCWWGGLPQYKHWLPAINEALSGSGYSLDAEGQLRVSKRPIAVRVPTIHDDRDGWNTLFDLWGQVNQDGLEATFDFSQCDGLAHSAVAFLGGLARLVER
jgi:hypothetical protein